MGCVQECCSGGRCCNQHWVTGCGDAKLQDALGTNGSACTSERSVKGEMGEEIDCDAFKSAASQIEFAAGEHSEREFCQTEDERTNFT